MKKQLSVTQIGENYRTSILSLISTFDVLRREILEKKRIVSEKNVNVKQKIENLVSLNKVNIDSNEYNRFKNSILQYCALLENVLGEISKEIDHLNLLLSAEVGENIEIEESYSSIDSFDAYVDAKIKINKKFIKTVSRDLTISFSRYNFGFDNQLRRISEIEAYVSKVHQASLEQNKIK
jgi:hypothetical protein